MDAKISVSHLTKDYGQGRGVFDVSFDIGEGECFGFLGPNGSGKTTTIRHILGFSAPQSGSVQINGIDCRRNAAKLMSRVGYVPGEIAFPESMTARGFLSYLAGLRGMPTMGRCEELSRRFELDLRERIRGMSLGARRKLAVVAAFMHDPAILVLDEPTSGLDPIMQDTFIRFVQEEKRRGKTILLSSHIFNEVAAICDRIAIIKAGRIAEEFDADALDGARAVIYQGSLLSAILTLPASELSRIEMRKCGGEPVVDIRHLTKDYGRGRGVFDISLQVAPGEVMGFVGTNGSGKTTTIRSLLGFINPTSGSARIFGRNSRESGADLMRRVSYIPGEIAFPRFSSALAFFQYQGNLLGVHDTAKRDELIERLRLDVRVNPRKMSKGMKQKTAIIAALMANKDVLLMDEPTTGLDPVMRDVFIELVREEKAKGRTILMSSHLFEEIEEVCDRVAVIHDGRIVTVLPVDALARLRGRAQDSNRDALEKRFKQIFRKED